jgi:hypothetical protein
MELHADMTTGLYPRLQVSQQAQHSSPQAKTSPSIEASTPKLRYAQSTAEQSKRFFAIRPLLLIFEYDLLGHGIYNLAVELCCLATWEADFLGEIVWQQVQKISISLLIQQRLVNELCVFVGIGPFCDRQVEM